MCSLPWSFELTYWGTTGSFPRIRSPHELTRQIAEQIWRLSQDGVLSEICGQAANVDELAKLVSEHFGGDSIPVPGGNTTCLELRTPETRILIDAGTGMDIWAKQYQRQHRDATGSGKRVHILLTHAHLDHTSALASASAMYDSSNRFTLWGMKEVIEQLQQLMKSTKQSPGRLVPIDWRQLAAIQEVCELQPGTTAIDLEGTGVTMLPLIHPGGALAFRFEREGKSVVVATDHEPIDHPDRQLVEFARDANVMYLDAQYLQSEYDGEQGIGELPPCSRRGWGHGTIETSISTGIASNVDELHLGHHDPNRTDQSFADLHDYIQRCVVEQTAKLRRRSKLIVRLAQEGASYRV